MTIHYNLRSADGAGLLLTLPEASKIPIPAVREAAEKFAKRAAQHRDARATFRAADDGVKRIRAEIAKLAADAAEEGGAVPSKKLLKRLRDSEDARDEARIVLDARSEALKKAHANVCAVIKHNTPRWHHFTVEAVDAAILKLATVHARLRDVGAELDEALSTFGLLNRLPVDFKPALMPVDFSNANVSKALEAMGTAIAFAMETLDREKGAAKSKPDVVVDVPGHETVDEKPADVEPAPADAALGEIEIGADADG